MSGSKIADLKFAAKDLIDTLAGGAASYSTVKFGIVPFSKYVNIGTTYSGSVWLDPPASGVGSGCVGSRSNPGDLDIHLPGHHTEINNPGSCPAEVTPLTNDYAKLHSEVDSMVATGATYIPAGLFWGWNLLDPDVPFTEAMSTAQRKKVKGQRVMVLMTDGENTLIPAYPEHVGLAASEPARSQDSIVANEITASVCEKIKAEGIRVYTVAFQITQNVAALSDPRLDMKALLSSCASDPSMAYDAANGAALKSAFKQIASDLASLYLSR
jgi:hypothetical protein